MPKNLGVNIFPDPVGHFGAHWRPFWILQVMQRCGRCDVAGVAALQAVRHCRRLASAPGAARLVFYFAMKGNSFISNLFDNKSHFFSTHYFVFVTFAILLGFV